MTYDGRSIDLVFTQEDGRPVSRQHVSALIHRSATQLGLDRSKLGTHVARRTAATILTDDKWPEGAVQVYLRHSVQQTIASKSYIRSAPDELRREMAGRLAELLDPWSTSPPSLFSAARGR